MGSEEDRGVWRPRGLWRRPMEDVSRGERRRHRAGEIRDWTGWRDPGRVKENLEGATEACIIQLSWMSSSRWRLTSHWW